MLGFKELSDHVGLHDQMQSNEDGSVVLINVFTVDSADLEALLAAWSHDTDFMRAQPGFVSTQLHQGIAGSCNFLNYAVWDSVESFRNAFSSAEFQSRLSNYPDSAVAAPHLLKKLAVAGH